MRNLLSTITLTFTCRLRQFVCAECRIHAVVQPVGSGQLEPFPGSEVHSRLRPTTQEVITPAAGCNSACAVGLRDGHNLKFQRFRLQQGLMGDRHGRWQGLSVETYLHTVRTPTGKGWAHRRAQGECS
jgi:hypothetical protein